jgi:hypothetical protein
MQLEKEEVQFLLNLGLEPIDIVGGPHDDELYWSPPKATSSDEPHTAEFEKEGVVSLYRYDKIMKVMLYAREILN